MSKFHYRKKEHTHFPFIQFEREEKEALVIWLVGMVDAAIEYGVCGICKHNKPEDWCSRNTGELFDVRAKALHASIPEKRLKDVLAADPSESVWVPVCSSCHNARCRIWHK